MMINQMVNYFSTQLVKNSIALKYLCTYGPLFSLEYNKPMTYSLYHDNFILADAKTYTP